MSADLESQVSDDEAPLLEMQTLSRHLACPQLLTHTLSRSDLLTLGTFLRLLAQGLTMQLGHSCKGCFHTVIDYKDDQPSAAILFKPGMTDVQVRRWILDALDLWGVAAEHISACTSSAGMG